MLFITKIRRLELVIKPSYYKIEEGRKIVIEGERIIFEDGKYSTNDKEKIDFLLNHRYFNKKFYLKGTIAFCQYCGRYFSIKVAKIQHEKYCKENPDRETEQPKELKDKK